MLAAAGFGSIAILTVVGTRPGTALPTLLFWRYVVAVPQLLLVARGEALRNLLADRRRLGRVMLYGGTGQALVTGLSLSALRWIPAATLVFLFYTYPSWVAVIAAIRGSERITATKALALVLSLVGIAVMVGDPRLGTLHPAGVALALGAAFVYAFYIPLIDSLQAGLTAATTTAATSTGAALIILAWAIGAGVFTADLPAQSWLAAALLATVSTTIAFIAFLRGLAVLGPVRTAIVATVEPFWTALLAAVVLHEAITPSTIAGGALIAVAVVLLQVRRGA